MDYEIYIEQSVAVLVDGNNIERSIHGLFDDEAMMLNFDTFIPKILENRGLNRLIYFREGSYISKKLADRLHDLFHGNVQPCYKSADIPLTIKATQLAPKVDTIIILSGDADYTDLFHHLKSLGVRVEIAAIEKTTNSVLKNIVDYFHPIQREDCFSLS